MSLTILAEGNTRTRKVQWNDAGYSFWDMKNCKDRDIDFGSVMKWRNRLDINQMITAVDQREFAAEHYSRSKKAK